MLNKVKSAYGGKKTKKAFTLIELLIVIAIIAILAALILISLSAARNRAKDVQVKSDMSSLSKAIEIMKVDQDLAAVSWAALNTTANDYSNITKWTDVDGKRLVTTLPTHPMTGQSYYIKILSGQDEFLLGKLTKGNDYYCMKNGNGDTITGANIGAAKNACEKLGQ